EELGLVWTRRFILRADFVPVGLHPAGSAHHLERANIVRLRDHHAERNANRLERAALRKADMDIAGEWVAGLDRNHIESRLTGREACRQKEACEDAFHKRLNSQTASARSRPPPLPPALCSHRVSAQAGPAKL